MVIYMALFAITILLGYPVSIRGKAGNEALKIFIIFEFIMLFILMSFRSSTLAIDYFGYQSIYNNITIKNDIFETIRINLVNSYVEPGFIILTILIKYIFQNSIWLFIISALFIMYPAYLCAKESEEPMLFILLFLSIGTYFESYNIMRTIMAAMICVMGKKYVIERKFCKFILCVLTGSMFHLLSILIIPLYFFLIGKANLKHTYIAIFTCIIFGLGLEYFFTKFLFYFPKYSLYSDLTNNSISFTSVGLKGILIPSIITIACIFASDQIKFNFDEKGKVLYNGTIIWGVLKILTIFASIFTRLAAYFTPYMLLFIPYIIYTTYFVKNGIKPTLSRKKIFWLETIIIIIIIIYVFAFRAGGYIVNYSFVKLVIN